MDRLNDTAKLYEMKININKTKIMRVSRNGGVLNITAEGQKVEQLSKFKYLHRVSGNRDPLELILN